MKLSRRRRCCTEHLNLNFYLIILSVLLQIVMGRLVCVSINVGLHYDPIYRNVCLHAGDYEITHLRVPDVCYPI